MDADIAMEHGMLLQFLYACPVGLLELSGDGRIGMLNPLSMQMIMPIMQPPRVMNFFDIMEPYAPELRNLMEDFTAPFGEVCNNLRIFIKPGTKQTDYMAHVLACTLVRLGEDRYMAALTDVSKAVAQERRLGEAEVWFASLLDGVDDFAVLSLDTKGVIDGTNSSLVRQTGFRGEEILGQRLDFFDVPSPASSYLTVAEQIELARRDGWYLVEGWQRRKERPPFWCQRLIAVRSENGIADRSAGGYTVILREVARRQHDALELKRMLTKDHLTGASNRAHFFEVAERECSRFQRHKLPLAIVALDVDHFKAVNDSHGHAAGDQVLREIAARCMALLRPEDTFARVGGEEFMILLPGTDLDGAQELAERLRAAVADDPVDFGEIRLGITGSFGCAEAEPDSCSISHIMEAADRALYEAKQIGRNVVVRAAAGEAMLG